MDLSETKYSEFSQSPPISTANQKPLTNYVSPLDAAFHSEKIEFPVEPTRVPRFAFTVDELVQKNPLPITPTAVEGYVNIDDIKADSYVELTNYKMNFPGQGSLVDLNKILDQLRAANYPVGRPSNTSGGTAIYEGFADLDKGYTEESILYEHDSVVSQFYIAALSLIGLLILYRMMKL
jgi:hypothetical protein